MASAKQNWLVRGASASWRRTVVERATLREVACEPQANTLSSLGLALPIDNPDGMLSPFWH